MERTNKGPHGKVTFKAYDQDQLWLLPPSLGDLIPPQHCARLINEIIDGLDLEPILHTYAGGGASNYHPRMLLKALVYGYVEQIYSSRGIAKALRENVCFMWLCGMQQPDHNTINRFRSGQLKDTVKNVFAQVLNLLIEQGHVRLEEYHIDGTILESVANRYTYVWAKNVARYKEGVLQKIAALLEQIEQANAQEETRHGDDSGGEPVRDSQALRQTIEGLNEQLREELTQDKKLKKKLDKLEGEHLPKLEGYEEQERILGDRSSYAKTDPDATFMRMKEDHMGQGQLKPAYNVQLGSEGQYVVNYTVHQNAGDRALLIEHMEDTHRQLSDIGRPLPRRISGDEGYGSTRNYEYLAEQGLENYVQYPGYYRERAGKFKADPFRKENLFYNAQGDFFVCPMGQRMPFVRSREKVYSNGYRAQLRIYQAQRCAGCPLQGQCLKGKSSRTIWVDTQLEAYRAEVRVNLNTLRGMRIRKRRSIDVEPIFGHWKANRGFRRFSMRSLEKVSLEIGLMALAHNIKKWFNNLKDLGRIIPLPPPRPPKQPHAAQLGLPTAWPGGLNGFLQAFKTHFWLLMKRNLRLT